MPMTDVSCESLYNIALEEHLRARRPADDYRVSPELWEPTGQFHTDRSVIMIDGADDPTIVPCLAYLYVETLHSEEI